MHFDGSNMRLGLRAGIVLSSPKGDQLPCALQIHFTASNNVAEYEALVHGLQLAKELGIRRILCYDDSDLVVQQCSGEWDARDRNMASYRFLVQKLSEFFVGYEFLHVPRAENEAADMLAKIASSLQSIPSGLSLEHLHKPSVKPSPDSESIYVPDDPAAPQPSPRAAEPGPGVAAAAVPNLAAAVPNLGAADPGSGAATPEPAMVAVFAVVMAPSWALPILEFLENRVLPMDETEARQVQRRASAYNIINNELVKRSSTSPPAGLSTPNHPDHLGFAVWGLDMVGPFKTARGGMTHLLVTVGKFTKWIEARPIKKLDGPTAVWFIKDIAVRYGMLNSIITDNCTNFAKGALTQYCSIFGICLDLASVAHPQSNGQVERANGLILSGIKPRLIEPLIRAPGSWLDELPAVLWSLHTTPNRLTGFTPFFLVYGAEAVILTDV
ncbi:uncharacterized protein [Aegilops tauschii subsp. strangulata]|uniref:uncharacterized protein n=1 Tax=Aegilops tauschii subsp. strangulata TaxID=200361 RepID=UPI00098B7F7F|nr:uncharacterized protein LOC109741905 [Aegilops tauschii subsp. strangulata]